MSCGWLLEALKYFPLMLAAACEASSPSSGRRCGSPEAVAPQTDLEPMAPLDGAAVLLMGAAAPSLGDARQQQPRHLTYLLHFDLRCVASLQGHGRRLAPPSDKYVH